jgi:glycosyltransferase involved in cell wall biosynthesis
MRILIVCPDSPYPPRDGGSLRIVNLVRSQSRRGEVALLTYVVSDDEAGLLQHFGEESGVKVYGVPRPARRNALTRAWHKLSLYYASYLFSPIPGPVRFNMRPVMRDALAQVLDDFRPDVILWEYWFMSGFAEQARQIAPQAIQILDEIDVAWIRLRRSIQVTDARSLWVRFMATRIRNYTLERFLRVDNVVMLSGADAQIVQRECPELDRLSVLPMGLMWESYPPLGPGRPGQLLFFGSFRHAPNVDALVFLLRHIFPRIRRERPGARLNIMGAAMPRWVSQLAHSAADVRVLGFQPDVRLALSEAAVVIAPLRFGSGVKVKLLEAMAFGKAVVTTSMGAEGIEAEPGVDWIVADDPDKFACETIRLLDSEAERVALGTHAREHIHRHHDASRIADDFVGRLADWQKKAMFDLSVVRC